MRDDRSKALIQESISLDRLFVNYFYSMYDRTNKHVEFQASEGQLTIDDRISTKLYIKRRYKIINYIIIMYIVLQI